MNGFSRIALSLGGLVTCGFGVWHFFIPSIWNWYASIRSDATELILAVKAINFFFSLALVLFGLMPIVLAWSQRSNRFSLAVVLVANILLWTSRVVLQFVFPQGSASMVMQYGMLCAFALTLACFVLALATMLGR